MLQGLKIQPVENSASVREFGFALKTQNRYSHKPGFSREKTTGHGTDQCFNSKKYYRDGLFSPQTSTPIAAFLEHKSSTERWRYLQDFANSSKTSPVCIKIYPVCSKTVYTEEAVMTLLSQCISIYTYYYTHKEKYFPLIFSASVENFGKQQ